jgi:hypothetical protein
MSTAGTYEVLSYANPEQRQKWHAICESFLDIDIFFYPEYAYLFELHGDGKAHCFVYYHSADDLVIYPFLKRCINELDIASDFPKKIFDITTPYGYGGFIRSSEKVDMTEFHKQFLTYCRTHNIVSEFVRFHPLIKNHLYLPEIETISQWNETVVIDLTVDYDALWKNIGKYHRKKIRKANKLGVKIIEDINFENIDDFCFIYYETMDRNKASNYYYFPKTWINEMVKLLKNKIALFHAVYDNKIIASYIFLYTGNFINSFLGGSLIEMRLGANHLLFYEVACWAKRLGFKYFQLGGGYKIQDGIFGFKASFSPLRAPFYIGKMVHDNDSYQMLCEKTVKRDRGEPSDNQFFPAYRTL